MKYIKWNMLLFGHSVLFCFLATLWTVFPQASLSMGFPREEYWSELLLPSPGDRPSPGIKPGSPALQTDSLSLSHQESSMECVQFSSVAQMCPTLCDPMNSRMPGLPVHHPLLESTQTHVHWVGDAIQPSHPLSSPSPLAFNLCQDQGLFQWVSSSHQVATVLEFQLQHQFF